MSACVVTFKSWAWQRINLPGKKTDGLTPAVRIYPITSFKPFFDLACTMAFWGTARSNIETMCVNANFKKYNKDSTYFEFMFDVIRGQMRWSEHKTVEAMTPIMTSEAVEEHFGSMILGADDAFDVLEEADSKLAKAEQVDVETDRATKEPFFMEYRRKQISLAKGGKDSMAVKCERSISKTLLNILDTYMTNTNMPSRLKMFMIKVNSKQIHFTFVISKS